MTRSIADLTWTHHAAQRCADRGIQGSVAALLLRHADLSVHAGRSCVSIRLGTDAAADLLADGVDPDLVRRARRLAAVMSDGGAVITILRPLGRRGRAYRRQFRGRRCVGA